MRKWGRGRGRAETGCTLMVGRLAAGRTAVDNCGHASSRRAAATTWAKLWPDCDNQKVHAVCLQHRQTTTRPTLPQTAWSNHSPRRAP